MTIFPDMQSVCEALKNGLASEKQKKVLNEENSKLINNISLNIEVAIIDWIKSKLEGSFEIKSKA